MVMKYNKKFNVGILGAGSWGGTIAWLIAKKGININLWTFSREEYNHLTKTKTLLRPLNTKLSKYIQPTMDLKKIANENNIIIFAVPASAFESTSRKLKKHKVNKNTIILSATKGIIGENGISPSEILKKYFPQNKIAVLSGPNIALDVMSSSPIVSVIASKDIKTANILQELISSENFRIYINNDITGIEISGALKNVIAIASGISDGFGFKISTKSALISRGLIEIARIALKKGGKLKTLLSSACIGDLIATCCSPNSRNYKVGYQLGKGEDLKTILKKLGQVAEGVETVKAMCKFSKRYKISCPIAEVVYDTVVKKMKPRQALKKLLKRPLPKYEIQI